jgi:hypothetical protein
LAITRNLKVKRNKLTVIFAKFLHEACFPNLSCTANYQWLSAFFVSPIPKKIKTFSLNIIHDTVIKQWQIYLLFVIKQWQINLNIVTKQGLKPGSPPLAKGGGRGCYKDAFGDMLCCYSVCPVAGNLGNEMVE